MDKKFDLRKQRDREELTGFLPTVDGRTIKTPPRVFVEALQDLCVFLDQPDWLTYQWGAVGPFRDGRNQHVLGLPRIVQLGLELQELSQRENFGALLDGFRNPPQFMDTVFEVHTASFFSRLNTTKGLRFSPDHVVRGRHRRPDFEVTNEVGVFSVECKRPHLHVQRAAEKFKAIADAIHDRLKQIDWPRTARLEVEVIASLRENPMTFAERIVQSGLAALSNGRTEFVEGPAHVFVVPRESPFRISDPKFGHDLMELGPEATGLFNPKMTMMRVVHNGLDQKFARSAGDRISGALSQLPEQQGGVIVLGEVPPRIADEAISKRIGEPAYDHVLAFVTNEIDSDDFHFTYRMQRRETIQQMVGAGVRPLFTAA